MVTLLAPLKRLLPGKAARFDLFSDPALSRFGDYPRKETMAHISRVGRFRRQTKDDPCGICGAKSLKKKHAVDHNHETGFLRGRLCVNCNMGIGHFKDSPLLLDAAKEYLLKSRRSEQEQLPQEPTRTETREFWDSVGPILRPFVREARLFQVKA